MRQRSSLHSGEKRTDTEGREADKRPHNRVGEGISLPPSTTPQRVRESGGMMGVNGSVGFFS